MFTGIIEDLGIIRRLGESAEEARLIVESKVCASDVKTGDSISVNGSCLTVVDVRGDLISFDISSETLKKSNLGKLKPGEGVNLERALRTDSRLGGHFVTGHIDTTGKIVSGEAEGGFIKIKIEVPKQVMAYLAEKGSIAVDGISLTVNSVRESSFSAMLIPHTISMTTLGHKKAGDIVNIETDILAKYTQRLISQAPKPSINSTNITNNFLKEHGFI